MCLTPVITDGMVGLTFNHVLGLRPMYLNLTQKTKTQPQTRDRSVRSLMKNGASSDMRRDLQVS